MSEPHAPTPTCYSPNTNPSQMNVIQHSLILNTIHGYMEFKSQFKSLFHSILLESSLLPLPLASRLTKQLCLPLLHILLLFFGQLTTHLPAGMRISLFLAISMSMIFSKLAKLRISDLAAVIHTKPGLLLSMLSVARTREKSLNDNCIF